MVSLSIPKSPGIYKITCIANGKIYIGSTNNFDTRWREHRRKLRLNSHQNKYLQRAWNKYSEAAFTFEIVELCMPWALLDREQYWLDTLKPYDHSIGFNIAHHADTPVRTPEVILKLRIASSGKSPSLSTRTKLSILNKGKVLSAEHRRKIGQGNKGKKRSQSAREKVSNAQRGKKELPENVAKRAESNRKAYRVISPDGCEMIIQNLKRFCQENQLRYSGMVNVANGYDRSHRGWKCFHNESET